jgi:hypothetical protein
VAFSKDTLVLVATNSLKYVRVATNSIKSKQCSRKLVLCSIEKLLPPPLALSAMVVIFHAPFFTHTHSFIELAHLVAPNTHLQFPSPCLRHCSCQWTASKDTKPHLFMVNRMHTRTHAFRRANASGLTRHLSRRTAFLGDEIGARVGRAARWGEDRIVRRHVGTGGATVYRRTAWLEERTENLTRLAALAFGIRQRGPDWATFFGLVWELG